MGPVVLGSPLGFVAELAQVSLEAVEVLAVEPLQLPAGAAHYSPLQRKNQQ